VALFGPGERRVVPGRDGVVLARPALLHPYERDHDEDRRQIASEMYQCPR
jgi:hypothetical protein